MTDSRRPGCPAADRRTSWPRSIAVRRAVAGRGRRRGASSGRSRSQPALNCFTDIWVDEAMEAADEAERGASPAATRSASLHGVPVAVKDTTPVAGHRTTLGSYAFEHWVPDHDAYVVARAAPGRRRHHRPDDDAGVRPHAADRQPAVGRHPQPARPSTARPAARRAAAAPPSRRAACRSPRAATWAARCASRRRGAASSGSSPASGGSRWTSCPACSTRSPTTGRWPAAPTTPGCSSPPRRVPTTPTSCRPRAARPRRAARRRPHGHAPRRCRSTSGAGPSTRRSPPPSTRRGRAPRGGRRHVERGRPGVHRRRRGGVGRAVGGVHGRLLRRTCSTSSRERMDPDVVALIDAGRRRSARRRTSGIEIQRTDLWRRLAADPRRPRRPAVPDDGRARRGRRRRPTRSSIPPDGRRRLPLPRHDRRVQPRVAVPGDLGAVRPARRGRATPACRSACRSSAAAGARTPCCGSPAPSRLTTDRASTRDAARPSSASASPQRTGVRRASVGRAPTRSRSWASTTIARRPRRRSSDACEVVPHAVGSGHHVDEAVERRRRRRGTGRAPSAPTASKNCGQPASARRARRRSSDARRRRAPSPRSAARACGGWLPAMTTRRPAARSAAKHGARRRTGRRRRSSRAARRGRRHRQRASSASTSMPGADDLEGVARAAGRAPPSPRARRASSAASTPETVGPRATRSGSRRRSVSPTSKATTAIRLHRPGR